MTCREPPEAVSLRVAGEIADGAAIEYASEMPDNEHSDVIWSIYGLPKTGEIAVLARAGELRLGKAGRSHLLHPAMADRVFGIDIADVALAHQLSHQLWAEQSNRLIAEAAKSQGG